MSFFKRLYEIVFSKLSMGLIAIASLVLAVYYGNFYEKKPEIKYEVISNNSVLDVHEKLGKLDIMYGGISLKKKNQGLRIITFRVVNTGAADIAKGDYDENAPLGFALTSGEILEKPELKTDDAYLTKNLKISLSDSKHATFSPVIFESNQSFEIKMLVLTSESNIPSLVSTGKVAGVKAIEVAVINKEDENIIGEKIKSAIFFFFKWYLLVTIFIVAPLMIVKDYVEKKKREKLVTEFKTAYGYKNLTVCQSHVVVSFAERGKKLFADMTQFQETYQKLRAVINVPNMPNLLKILEERYNFTYIDKLRTGGCLHISDTDIIIAEEMTRIVEELSQFLISKGYKLT